MDTTSQVRTKVKQVLGTMTDGHHSKAFRHDDEEIYPTLTSAASAMIHERDERSTQTYESPKKKARISTHVLLKVKKNSTAIQTIGYVLRLSKCQANVIQNGQLQVKDLLCTVVENRIGRTSCDQYKKDGIRFIYVADYTGFMSIGLVGRETGLSQYDLTNEQCDQGLVCVFNASISGRIAWRPSSSVPSSPTFFLNNGSVKKINVTGWEQTEWKCFPTSDVLEQLVNSRFASSSSYGTVGTAGKIDNIIDKETELILSLEDPVGFVAVSLDLEKCDASKVLKTREQCGVGSRVFITGMLDMQSLFDNESTVLFARVSEVNVISIAEKDYMVYIEMMLPTPPSHFNGVKPEQM